MDRTKLKKIFEFILMLISGAVVIILLKNNAAPWKVVCLYWATLTAKNLNESLNGLVKKG